MSNIELKVVRTANRVYRGVVGLALRSLNARDKRELKRLEQSMQYANDLRNTARSLTNQASDVEVKANRAYDEQSRNITAAYNTLENVREDLTLTEI